jgi:hypothetical protein
MTLVSVVAAAGNVVAADPKGSMARIDPADCAGFTARDAAPFLGAPAAEVVRKVEKMTPTLFACSYAAGKASPGIAFSIEVSPTVRKAAEEMERYRDNLVVAGETAPWKGKLPKGAYSDLSGPGLGDDAVWTDINGSLTVRKGNVKVQVMTPKGKLPQVNLVEAVVAKF